MVRKNGEISEGKEYPVKKLEKPMLQFNLPVKLSSRLFFPLGFNNFETQRPQVPLQIKNVITYNEASLLFQNWKFLIRDSPHAMVYMVYI